MICAPLAVAKKRKKLTKIFKIRIFVSLSLGNASHQRLSRGRLESVKKTFVLDTNIILYDPTSIFRFAENTVVIPMVVLEEADKFKRELSETGRSARQFARILDDLRTRGSLAKGMVLENGGTIRVEVGNYEDTLPPELNNSKADHRILGLVLHIQKKRPEESVVFITKDINLRIKADVLGIDAQDYSADNQEQKDGLYAGVTEVVTESDKIDLFYTTKKLLARELEVPKLFANQYVILRDKLNSHHTAIARYDSETESLIPLIRPSEGIWGVFPKNVEQSFAIDLLLNDEIKLVSLVGKAGTGKTLLAIAAGLAKTVDEGVFTRLLVSRPIFPLGKDIGFLPGSVEDKLNPWMQPIFDNIDFLFGATSPGGRSQGKRGVLGRGAKELSAQGLLQIEPLTYIRGRSIPNQFLIVDEAQNLTPHEIKTIITRAGDGTKIVLTGDCFQIDNPYVDSINNGLAYCVERFKEESISGHVTMTKGERSQLSELASQLL